MDVSTRPSHDGREGPGLSFSARLAAIFLASAMFVTIPTFAAAPSPEIDPEDERTGTLSPSSPHEFYIAQVAAGSEGIHLRARLTETSDAIARNVIWKITNASGETVLDAQSSQAEVPLPPGQYVAEATFGAVRLRENLDILEGQNLDVTFVLNAGGVRILPRLKTLALPQVGSRSVVYALSSKSRGEPVVTSTIPGEIISLAAGPYRIESQIGSGNAVAVMDVNIKAGIMSAVEIDHKGGVARLAYVGAPDSDVRWEVKSGKTSVIKGLKGLSTSLVLHPGEYTAIAIIGDETLTAKFRIEDGQERDIMLGN